MLRGAGALLVPVAVDLGEDKAQGGRLGWMDTAGSVPMVALGRGDGDWTVPQAVPGK